MEKKKLMYLGPKQDHYGYEIVNEGIFSSRDFFAVNPNAEMDDYNEGYRIDYLNGKELHAEDGNPYAFFCRC